MLQTLRNRRNRKGFTLAELLIVVAIIAVLVAIAVPLFVGALNNAEQRVKDANIRSVRAAAVNEILLNYDKYKLGTEDVDTDSNPETPDEAVDQTSWLATAYVTADGSVEGLKIDPLTEAEAEDVETKCIDYTEEDGIRKYTVTVHITELKVTE